MKKAIIIRFAEIHLKGKNRGYFERMEKRRKKDEIDLQKRLEILDAVLKAAEEKGLENEQSYLTLRKIYEAHNDSKTNFNNKNKTERNFWKFGDKATSVCSWFVGGLAAGAGTLATIGTAATTTATVLGATIAVGFWPVTLAVGIVVGCVALGFAFGKRSDAEVIDDCIKDLHKKLKAQEAPVPKAQAPEAQTVTDIAAPVDTTIQSTPSDTTTVVGTKIYTKT
jgi:hypothetical protein